jgi:hypothetical protein
VTTTNPIRVAKTQAVCIGIEEELDAKGWTIFSESPGQAAMLVLPGGCGCLAESFERGMSACTEDLRGPEALIWWQLPDNVLIERALLCFDEDHPEFEPFAMEAFGVRGYPDCYEGEGCDGGDYQYQMLQSAIAHQLDNIRPRFVPRGKPQDLTALP